MREPARGVDFRNNAADGNGKCDELQRLALARPGDGGEFTWLRVVRRDRPRPRFADAVRIVVVRLMQPYRASWRCRQGEEAGTTDAHGGKHRLVGQASVGGGRQCTSILWAVDTTSDIPSPTRGLLSSESVNFPLLR